MVGGAWREVIQRDSVCVCHTAVAASTSQLLNKSDDDGMNGLLREEIVCGSNNTTNTCSNVRMRNLLLSEVC